nr:minor capsid protein [uncultured Anaerostipes sp.]
MANLNYWKRRKAWQMYKAMEQTEFVADDIARLYYKASRYIGYKMEHIFRKYMDKNHLSEEEAFHLLNSLNDLTSFDELRQALKNNPDSEAKAAILAELEAPSYATRIERLQELQQQTDLMMRGIYRQEKDFNTRHYVNLAYDTYHRGIFDIQQRAGYGLSFAEVDHKTIDSILSSDWSGENYSSRIWKNTQGLAQEVKQDLLMDVLTGQTYKEAADRITKKFAGGASASRRLIRTESNFVHGQMEMKSYEECGIKTYIFVATLDLKTSSICRELDEKRFPVSEQQPGVNCNPMHPWCRSTTICDISDEELAQMQRRAYDLKTKRSRTVPANMTYEQWYKEYVESSPEALVQERMTKNRGADRRQLQKYNKVLGPDKIENLDVFQDLKYNNSEKYGFVKLDYSRKHRLMEHPELSLQNAEQVIIPEPKFTKYLFGGDNQAGLAKGKAFTSRLGYDAKNWGKLESEIKSRSKLYPATEKISDQYGTRFEQKMILYGEKDMPANVVVGWIHKPDGTLSMTSAYIKEVK